MRPKIPRNVSASVHSAVRPCLLDLGSQTEITTPDVETWVPVMQTQSSRLPHHRLGCSAISSGLQASNFLSLMTLSNSSRHYDYSKKWDLCLTENKIPYIVYLVTKQIFRKIILFKTPVLSKKRIPWKLLGFTS